MNMITVLTLSVAVLMALTAAIILFLRYLFDRISEYEQSPKYVERTAFVSCKDSGCSRNISPGCCECESVFYSPGDSEPTTICEKRVKIVQDPRIVVEVIKEDKK